MKKKFKPHYTITDTIASALMRIEACQQAVVLLPITPIVLAKLRESSRLQSVHYSTMIEGNRLTKEQIIKVIKQHKTIPGRERDEKEVKGYYAALDALQKYVAKGDPISERVIQTLHALVMAGGRTRVKPTLYRPGQNVIKEAGTGRIVYLPPEAKDVPGLMGRLVEWITQKNKKIPCPIVAAIAHYQFATIHPYYDGNGHVARLLATLIVHEGGYGLKGIYSLDEYYARDSEAYYEALTLGPSHNYYMGREQADITPWVEYFCVGMAHAFERVQLRAEKAAKSGALDQTLLLRELDSKQRKVLELFRQHEYVTANKIAELFGFVPRTARNLCVKWVETGFLEVGDPSRKGRTYILSKQFLPLIEK